MNAGKMSQSTSLSNKLYFILMKDCFGEKRVKLQILKTKNEKVMVLKGSLWFMEKKSFDEMTKTNRGKLHSAEASEMSLTCESQDITKLSETEFQLLLALTTFKERFSLFCHEGRLHDACRLYEYFQSNDDCLLPVDILDEKGSEENMTGTLKYVGPIPGRSGYWFGIELDLKYRSNSNTDGIFDGERKFSCQPDNGLVAAINKVFVKPKIIDSFYPASRSTQSNHSPSPKIESWQTPSRSLIPTQNSFDYRQSRFEPPKPLIDYGDRVVWYSDVGPELGIVRWMGRLDNLPDQYTIGVEFDNPIGSGTGFHNNVELFQAKLNHASLVPALGLIKAEEFYGSKDLIPSPPNLSRDYEQSDGAILTNFGDSRWATFEKQQLALLNQTRLPLCEAMDSCDALDQPGPIFPDEDKTLEGSVRSRGLNIEQGMEECDAWATEGSTVKPSRDCTSRKGEKIQNITMGPHSPHTASSNIYMPLNREFQHVQPYDMTDVGEERRRLEPPRSSYKTPSSGDVIGSVSIPTRDRCASDTLAMTRSDQAATSNNKCHTAPLVLPGSDMTSQVSQKEPSETSYSIAGTSDDGPTPIDPAKYKIDLDVGSMVEVDIPGSESFQYGVVRWIGHVRNIPIVGVELEEECLAGTDGVFGRTRLFTCPAKRGFFSKLKGVRRDKRFAESSILLQRSESQAFGSLDCVEITGIHEHLNIEDSRTLREYIRNCVLKQEKHFVNGKNLGIQGHHNSCYLDATLFGMFMFSYTFDSLLHRKPKQEDISKYSEIQKTLRDGIVNPLRCNMFVRADKVLQLRKLLSECSSVHGFLTEEKDPEEFLNSLLQETLKVEPFIKLSSGHSGYFYQLIVELEEFPLPTTQQLFSLSLYQSDIKLCEVPSCLILQMPRFGKDFQMYKRIMPSLTLDITMMLQKDPQPCYICGKIATQECKECFREFNKTVERVPFCDQCLAASHSATVRSKHRPQRIDVYEAAVEHFTCGGGDIRSEILELFAVICIKTSHYVAFTKCGEAVDSPWVFFDSMADRCGQLHGYNIPQVVECQYIPEYLKEEKRADILKTADDKDLPDEVRRVICDGYICMYRSPLLKYYR